MGKNLKKLKKTYKITRKATLQQIDFKANDYEELMELYKEGVVDEALSEINEHLHYKITDEIGNVVYEHTYT